MTAELARGVLRVPLVEDAWRLAVWTGERPLTPAGVLSAGDAAEAVRTLGLRFPADELARPRPPHVLWVVVVNTRLVRVERGVARPGPRVGELAVGEPDKLLAFWDEVVMDVLDRADFGLTGSAEIDAGLVDLLTMLYAEGEPVPVARLGHPEAIDQALDVLAYCGLVGRAATGVGLTPLGRTAVRAELRRAFTAPGS
ncbi:hypothetical protein [Bailinhaonella thermotolerans]|uniref:Uncharacterized protein n=1 Tax=Bailinhaonella thermotolerans TaxID=1070861 RepID=A0A3A4AZX8_9ACTN|nr:hypothetical protein [Bailinhaonella thermotolerans]RJL31347.1 hypothetical protein D5H75_20100 [Bailinhaonella thermotolerans]